MVIFYIIWWYTYIYIYYIYSYIISDMRYVNTCKYLYIILYNASGYSRSFPQVFGFPFFLGGPHRTWDGFDTRPGNPGGTLLEIQYLIYWGDGFTIISSITIDHIENQLIRDDYPLQLVVMSIKMGLTHAPGPRLNGTPNMPISSFFWCFFNPKTIQGHFLGPGPAFTTIIISHSNCPSPY